MVEFVVKGSWRAREKRVALQVYLPTSEPLRMLNSSDNELAVGEPTVSPSPFTILFPSAFNQVNRGVLWIPS